MPMGNDLEEGERNSTISEIMPRIAFVDLMQMAFATATSTDMIEKRRHFVDKCSSAGGYCLVELIDNDDDVDGDGVLLQR